MQGRVPCVGGTDERPGPDGTQWKSGGIGKESRCQS